MTPRQLQRYLSRYGLLEAHGSLSYHHAVFPVPPMPSNLVPPLTGRVLNKTRSKPAHTLRSYEEHVPVLTHEPGTGAGSVLVPSAEPHSRASSSSASAANNAKKRVWQEPKTQEFAELTAYDDPQIVVDRLAARAKTHWDKKDSVKEGCVAG